MAMPEQGRDNFLPFQEDISAYCKRTDICLFLQPIAFVHKSHGNSCFTGVKKQGDLLEVT